jgi:MFS family permease
VGGVVADFFGRRHSLALSLTLYGIGSAFVGLLQDNVIFLVAYAVNGLSWGILFVLYIFVVWGDLATEKNVERMYSVGLVVFYSILGVGVFSPQISQAPLITTALASCLLIFFLNVPVLLAPELLPSDVREKARLALHIKAVKKIRRKPKG